MKSLPPTVWIELREASLIPAVRLLCFPYAGGSAAIFRLWQQQLPEAVEVCPVQLPGRGRRLSENPLRRLADIVRASNEGLNSYLDEPYALFGHSLGALVAYEFARYRDALGRRGPELVIVSGSRPPSAGAMRPPTFHLPDSEFIEELRRVKGTPDQLLASPELMELLLPMLRADFEAVQTYEHRPGKELGVPLLSLGGLDDPHVTAADIRAWQVHTTAAFSYRMLPGGHFFLNECPAEVLRQVRAALNRPVARLSAVTA